MEHKFLRLYVDGVWTGKADRTITVQEGKDVVKYDLDEYAKQHGIELPDAKKGKKAVNTIEDIQEKEDADMGSTQSEGSAKES